MNIKKINYLFLLFLFTAFSCISNSGKSALAEQQLNLIPNKIESSSNNSITSQNQNESLNIISWNIQDLGRSKNDNELHQIAQILRNSDLVAIQEVVAKDPAGAQAVAKIADELNRMGNKWDYRVSDPTNSPSAYISERYAYLWKTSKVKLLNKASLDKELENECLREPFIGKFQMKKGGEPFYVINFHSRKFNDRPEEEIIHFKYYPERLNSERILLAGDFNLNEKHNVWENLYKIGFKPALKDTKTTLKIKCKNGNYLNHSIDNIYFTQSGIKMISSGSIDIVENCGNLEKARFLSDHLPVYLNCKL
ncbi:endonuclease/exonuclease/phosphatase family protein [Aestuariibaculum lutulentum]|uniref:Endonuclease/exonuclease/phosphatase family protein n=1 Tax=Aestuariibaculum lutulentum TaxID=2920935 RepID=A0ABS9RGY1_9FLAO|nr:endonuclease/exonuclease/phosphatase family protein [Aestuariibaculum lutulentum]MCH4552205.1 endonuclease/exonuclease/phosphatase family protein [Aestuariibaculum lutulentum]